MSFFLKTFFISYILFLLVEYKAQGTILLWQVIHLQINYSKKMCTAFINKIAF